MAPPISVIMAVKNEMPHLSLAVESILNQSFADFEFIVTDDSSSDGTLEYLRSLKDKRLLLEKNAGVGQTAGLNQGLRMARAEWIARMDGDDWSYPDRLEKQWHVASTNPTVVFISSDYLICDEQLTPVAPIRLDAAHPECVMRYFDRRNNPFCHPTALFKRIEALQAGGYNESLKNAQDIDLWKRLLKKGEWKHTPEVLVKYRVRKQSLSVLRHPEQDRERKAVFSKSGPLSPVCCPSSPRDTANKRMVNGLYAYKLGFAAWLAGKRGIALKYLLNALANRVRPLRAVMLMFSMVFPRHVYLDLSGYKGVYQ
ncbi:MAG: glycosyltransferase [Elusimicrobia bacterium]|nr:glycosyltransferase [Candidatus Obscuribacterium magneticum]